MPFCPYCGMETSDGMRFCPGCGKQLEQAPAAPQTLPPIDLSAPVERQDYGVILVSQGTATKTALRELLEDLFGYTVTDARKLTNNCPVEVGRLMTGDQARFAAQALTEYGAEVAVYNSNGWVDPGAFPRAAVFTAAGLLTATAAAAFAALTSHNRVGVFTPCVRPDLYLHVYAPRFRPVAPPPHVRRAVRPVPPPPRPAPRRTAPPPPPPAPRPPKPVRQPPKPPAPVPPARQAGHGPGRGPGPGPRGRR